MIRCWAVVAAFSLSVALAQADGDGAAQLYVALSASLNPDASRPVPRLAEVSVDSSGDATVIFAIRNEDDDAPLTRAGALADTLTVLRTVFETADVSSVTVLGTFPFQSTKGKSVRESPVLRAVLKADRAHTLNWDQVAPDDLPVVVDVWWLQGAFAKV